MVLLERDSLLASLETELALARSGAGRLVLLTGEAGIGKSSVMAAFLTNHADDVRTVVGYCDPLESPRSLGPFVDMASTLDEDLHQTLRSNVEPRRVMSWVRDLLVSEPTIAVVEDAHWADDATLDLLVFLARRLRDAPLLLVVTFRSDEVGGTHPLRHALGRLSGEPVTRLAVPGLSLAAVEDLCAETATPAGTLHDLTGGNPFYVTEVLATGASELPATVVDSVLARASTLAPEARRTLEAVSVLPRGGAISLVTQLVTDASTIDECLESGLLRTDGALVTFRHEVARRAVEQSLAPVRRRSLHAEVLQLITADAATEPVDPAELAHHAQGAGDRELTTTYALEAARRAQALGAQRDAARHFEVALAGLGSDATEVRAEALEGLARASNAAGRAGAAATAYEDAARLRLELGDPDQAARDRLRQATSLGSDGQAPLARTLVDALVVELEAGTSPVLADAHAEQAMQRMLARDTGGAVSAGHRALELALPDAAATQGLAWNAIGAALWFSRPDEAEAALERGLQLAREAGDDQLIASILVNLGSGAGEVRRYDVAARWLDEAISWCAAHDLDGRGDYATAWRARVLLETGDWTAAAGLASRVISKPSLTISRIVALTVVGTIRVRRGDPEAASALDEAWDLAARTGDLQRLWPAASALAELAWWRDGTVADPARLDQILDRAIASAHEWAVGDLGVWLSRAGQKRLTPGAAAPYAARLVGDFSQARKDWIDLGCPFEAAWVSMDDGSEESLLLALAEFEELGAAVPATRCREALRRLGTAHIPRGARQATAAHPQGLTAREDEVFAFVREGLSNREIASRLTLSTRTVDHHVAAVLRKLGVSSRSEAAALVRTTNPT
ncbi:MAG: helix-turn-helix transcriptional regulator [Aeromicrobium sp.]|nr:helix-turn-helix transcriptional regulator [Aeromicrobium sp.]